MLKEKLTFERRKAICLTVEFNGTVEEYAMAWLKLTNNAREYDNMIWKIHNCSGNEVFVYCNPKSVDAVKDFCTGIVALYSEKDDEVHYIGEVIGEEEVTVGVPIYDYESDSKDDEEWENDMDNAVHFHDWMPVKVD